MNINCYLIKDVESTEWIFISLRSNIKRALQIRKRKSRFGTLNHNTQYYSEHTHRQHTNEKNETNQIESNRIKLNEIESTIHAYMQMHARTHACKHA
jgi:hypothetical protein